MYELPWLVTIGIALVATVAWAVLDRRRMFMTGTSAGTWALLAFGSARITRITETGTEVTYNPDFVQFVFAFLAAVSFLALVAVAWWGNLPLARPTPAEVDT